MLASSISASWIPEESGTFKVHIRVFTSDGREEINGSPFTVQVVDRAYFRKIN